MFAADGRHSQLGLAPGQQPLLSIEMAEALGQVSLGLCASEGPGALPITVPTPAGTAAGSNGIMLLCPVGCNSPTAARPLLLALHGPAPAPYGATNGGKGSRREGPTGQGPGGLDTQRQREQLLLITRRLGELLNAP
ncbi:MAG: hypothetical protein ACKO8I_07075 [Cyanobacteriota bacterium]